MIGSILQHHRERMGLSQRELAERAGMPHRTIGRLERERDRIPELPTIWALAAALDDEGAAALLAAVGLQPPDPLADEVLRDVETKLQAMSEARKRALLRAFEILVRIA